MNFLERAQPLLERSFSVIPLRPGAKDTLPGIGAKNRSRDIVQVREWAEQYPDANVAIVADEEVAILESDDFERLAQTIKLSTGETLPITLTACGSSPNRPHLFFKHTEKSRKVGCIALPGLFEARFVNQYVVGPGSVHPNGSTYRFLNDAPIVEIPDRLVDGLVWLAGAQKSERRNTTVERGKDGRVPEGGRHYYRFSELGRLWDGQKTEQEMLAIGLALNEQCDPPEPEAEVLAEVRDIMKRAPHDPGPQVVIGRTETPEDWAPMSADDLVCLEIPPRTAILTESGSPVFYESSVNQLLAWRGTGKTLFGLGLANAFASGGQILGFKADRPRKVLYLDGELPLSQLQERVRDLVALENRRNVQLFNPEMLPTPRGIDLLHGGDFAALKRMAARTKAEVLILDSQSTLMSGDSNKTEFQEPRQAALRELRWMGLCVIETHHLGKQGLQRGSSKNDDILDMQIRLNRVKDWEPADGLLFELTYEKIRHAARLDSGYQVSLEDGLWVRQESDELKSAAELFKQGKSEREVARELDITSSKARRLKIKASKQSLLELNERTASLREPQTHLRGVCSREAPEAGEAPPVTPTK